MTDCNYRFIVTAEDEANAAQATGALADALRDVEGVYDVERSKQNNETMDIGTIVSLIATSGATLSIAQGLAAWLKARRGVEVVIERNNKSESLKTHLTGLDPATAERIVEIVRK